MNQKKYTQSTIYTPFDFGNTNSFSFNGDLNTTTQGNTNFTLNPAYTCRCRRGYSLTNDPFNPWGRQEEPANYSRGEIARSYRLQLPKGAY